MEYSFHIYNKLAADGVTMSADRLLHTDFLRKNNKMKGAGTDSIPLLSEKEAWAIEKPPVIVCVGSDLAIGDSLGPITGSMLKYKTQGLDVFLYGTLAAPVTAKEIKYLRAFLKETHPFSQVIAVDAAVGAEGDIGMIKLNDQPLYPGAGANKKLGAVGDLSLMAIVAEKSVANFGLLNTTRLHLVYSMAETISDALSSLLWDRCQKKQSLSVQNS